MRTARLPPYPGPMLGGQVCILTPYGIPTPQYTPLPMEYPPPGISTLLWYTTIPEGTWDQSCTPLSE